MSTTDPNQRPIRWTLTEPSGASAQSTSTYSAVLRTTLGVLGAIASGIGVLGFLVFIGGAVQLARDRGAGVSGVVGAPLIPRDQLLTSGADQLFTPFLVTLAIVALGVLFLVIAHHIRGATWWPTHRCQILVVILGVLLVAAAIGLALFQNAIGDPSPGNRQDFGTTRDMAFLVLLVGVPAAFYFVRRLLPGNRCRRTSAEIGLLVVLALAAVAIGSLYTIAINEWNPPLQPVAITRKGLPAVAGIYIGEDATHVYVAVIATHLGQNYSNSQQSTRIVTVDRDTIAGIERGSVSFRIGGNRAAHRDPTLLTAAEAGLLEDLLLPTPPRFQQIKAVLGSLSLPALRHYYVKHYGTWEPVAQRRCVRSVFEPAKSETTEQAAQKEQAAEKRQPAEKAEEASEKLEEAARMAEEASLTPRTASLAEFLYLLREQNPTARQMLNQLELTCAVDGKPAFT
jgi:hypothetical protein